MSDTDSLSDPDPLLQSCLTRPPHIHIHLTSGTDTEGGAGQAAKNLWIGRTWGTPIHQRAATRRSQVSRTIRTFVAGVGVTDLPSNHPLYLSQSPFNSCRHIHLGLTPPPPLSRFPCMSTVPSFHFSSSSHQSLLPVLPFVICLTPSPFYTTYSLSRHPCQGRGPSPRRQARQLLRRST
jgi:hypothetical protein